MITVRTITSFQENTNDKLFIDDISFIKEKLSFLSPRTIRVASLSESLETNKDFINSNDIWGVSKRIHSNDLLNEKSIENIVNNISRNKKLFYSVNLSNREEINTQHIFKTTELIRKVSLLGKQDGFSNFQLGIGFNISEYTPYFPYSFSLEENYKQNTKISLGLEIINFIKDIIKKNDRTSIKNLKFVIKNSLQEKLLILQEKILKEIRAHSRKIDFIGFDISLSPFPYLHGESSVVELIEILGNLGRSRSKINFKFGDPGTQFCHTFFTSILKEIQQENTVRTVGFCSAMYSVLEDNLLSTYYSSEKIDYKNLLLLSTTCGCGIDMLPLNRQVRDEEIYGYLLDTYCLSFRLKKPLGVRLLIDNNKSHKDLTTYEDIFFSNLVLKESINGPHFLKLPAQTKENINF